jgi:hypothetical protein
MFMMDIEKRVKYLSDKFIKTFREKNIQEAFTEIAWHIAALEMQLDKDDEVEVLEE